MSDAGGGDYGGVCLSGREEGRGEVAYAAEGENRGGRRKEVGDVEGKGGCS